MHVTINQDKDEAVEKEADVKGRHEEKEDDVSELMMFICVQYEGVELFLRWVKFA